MPIEYLTQIRHELYCTSAAWCDYLSFHPSFPEGLRSVLVRVTRDDVDLPGYETMVRAFLDEVDAEYQRVLEMAA